jgi:hypothetical protein
MAPMKSGLTQQASLPGAVNLRQSVAPVNASHPCHPCHLWLLFPATHFAATDGTDGTDGNSREEIRELFDQPARAHHDLRGHRPDARPAFRRKKTLLPAAAEGNLCPLCSKSLLG